MPASAALAAVASTVSTGALSRVCSASMIPATASAKPVDSRAVDGAPALAATCRRSAHGTTISETNGAAAMPSATNDSPSAIPTATSTGNMKRETDSISTSPP